MRGIARFYNRSVQAILRFAMLFLHIGTPKLLFCLPDLAFAMKKEGLSKPLLVCGQSVMKAGLPSKVEVCLAKAGIPLVIFSGAVPDSTFACIQEGYETYAKAGCDCLIALGGGSSMDAAKAIGIEVAYHGASLTKFKGVLKVHRKIPTLFAIPTTAGTGSEATLAAVVVNEENHDKFQIDSPRLVPSYALLEPSFLSGLPKKVIASTGMDALTHAVEAYIGRSNTFFTKKEAEIATKLIAENLEAFYEDPSNLASAKGMQLAAYHAGVAFTRAYVGYVHALAHSLGGYYGVAHGYANAVLLPVVLKAYGKSVEKPLARLAPYFGCQKGSVAESSRAFITKIETMNRALGIPKDLAGTIKEEDFASLSLHAGKEGNPLYPVPRLFDAQELEAILRSCNGEEKQHD